MFDLRLVDSKDEEAVHKDYQLYSKIFNVFEVFLTHKVI